MHAPPEVALQYIAGHCYYQLLVSFFCHTRPCGKDLWDRAIVGISVVIIHPHPPTPPPLTFGTNFLFVFSALLEEPKLNLSFGTQIFSVPNPNPTQTQPIVKLIVKLKVNIALQNC